MMARLGFTNITSLLFNFLTISNIIYNKQSFYDQLTTRNNWNAYYDYIIVGGGTAGSVLAARLSENAKISILLLEAGSSETVTSNTPGLSETLIGTVMDWKLLSIPQNYSCLAMNEQRCHLASGRVIGGTSSINRMYYLRGHPADFDLWGEKFGLKLWTWKDVFPFLKRNENQKDPEKAKTGNYGVNGKIPIGQAIKVTSVLNEDKILESFLEASNQFGYYANDLNTPIINGSSILQSTIYQGKRNSMSSAFLEPNLKNRPNLHLLTNSVVVKILFDNNRAIGVKFYRDWQQYSVYARQEVIISAGALNSPKLLLLSGIGPKEELNKHQIPIVSDLPVGENFHDHIGSLGLYFVANDLPEPGINKQHLKQYFYYGKGPLAESNYAATIFRSKSNSFKNSIQTIKESPDLMLLNYVNGLTNREFSAELTEQQINLKHSVWESYYGEKLKLTNGKLQFTILPIVLKPKSRGIIKLKSTNPFDAPYINPNYLSHPDDLNLIVQAMHEALKIARSKSFKKYKTNWFQSAVPGCEKEFEKFKSELKEMFEDALNSDIETIVNQLLTSESLDQTTTSTANTSFSINNTNNQPALFQQSNLPFHFVSSFVSKLFRRSSMNKNQKVGKQIRMPKLFSNYTSYYNQYWLGNGLSNNYQNRMMHPLINKTIYGTLVDGFSSPGSSTNSDLGIITVWNSHSDRNRPKPGELIRKTSTTTTTTTSPTLLDSDVSPIVLTGYFSSPPNIQPTLTNFEDNTQAIYSPLKQINKLNNNADEYLKCMARMMTISLGDYAGTCRMGSSGDKNRVVDERFVVVGTKNLRVIDNSVVPEITSGGMAAVAIMLGERGAHFIKEDRI